MSNIFIQRWSLSSEVSISDLRPVLFPTYMNILFPVALPKPAYFFSVQLNPLNNTSGEIKAINSYKKVSYNQREEEIRK